MNSSRVELQLREKVRIKKLKCVSDLRRRTSRSVNWRDTAIKFTVRTIVPIRFSSKKIINRKINHFWNHFEIKYIPLIETTT